MFWFLRVVLLQLYSPPTVAAATTFPTVSLSYGTFQGAFNGNLSAFRGVPFAAPAVRFALPKAPVKLHGLQNASAFGPACPQQQLSTLPLVGNLGVAHIVSEDCLTLDVYAPNTAGPASKLPVFFWIYGGGFEVGSSQDEDLRPLVERSILNGDPIVAVAVNYRLNAFGFLGGKEVLDAGISNLGLRDQIFALEWVQQYVAEFGGDPNRVVIGGFSAGATSTGLLLLNNNRFDQTSLFRGAFMLSGSPITSPLITSPSTQSAYDSLVAANNCTDTGSQDQNSTFSTLACLREVPFVELMATINKTPNFAGYQSLQLYWRPQVDGEVLVQDPLVSISRGAYAKIPVITGDVEDEGTLFSLSNLNITTDDQFAGYLHSNYLPASTKEQIAELVALYPNDPAEGSPFGTGDANELTPEYKRLAAFQGDYFFVGMRRFFLEHASKTQAAWSYLSKRATSIPALGVYHTSGVPMWFLENQTDYVAADALINFITTLNPNGVKSESDTSSPLGVFWPMWNTSLTGNSAPSLLTFGDPLTVNVTAENFRVDAIKYLNSLQLVLAEEEST